jgi:hypothetical protein
MSICNAISLCPPTSTLLDLLYQPMQPQQVQENDWTTASTYTYNVTLADMRLFNTLWIYVRNSDGVNLDSEFAGDLQCAFGSLEVSDCRLPAEIQQVRVEYANNKSVIPDPEQTPIPVGTKVRIVATGEDPKGLPLQYTFHLFRSCGAVGVEQAWSSINAFELTLAPEDVTSCTVVFVYVRNSDGWAHLRSSGSESGADN